VRKAGGRNVSAAEAAREQSEVEGVAMAVLEIDRAGLFLARR